MKRKMRANFVAYVPDAKGIKHKKSGEVILFTDSNEFATIADAARDAVRQQHDELRAVPIEVKEYRDAA